MSLSRRHEAEKVLIVDDDVNLLDGLARSLGRYYAVFTATTGAEALAMCVERGPFAVVVSDMWMPMMNGISFLRELRKVSPHSVGIILTGDNNQLTAVDAINEGGIFRFHRKPCHSNELATSIRMGVEEYGRRRLGRGEMADHRRVDALGMAFEIFGDMKRSIRAPLTDIMGVSEVLTSLLPEDDAYRSSIDVISRSSRQLHDKLSKLEAIHGGGETTFKLRRKRIAFGDLVGRVVAEAGPELERRRLGVRHDAAPHFPVLYLDAAVFNQLFGQLLDHAIDGSLDGGTIVIRGDVASNGEPVISISDSGVGMSPGEVHQAMDMALERRGQEVFSDDSLRGLMLARVLGEIHDVKVRLLSRLGEGSVRYIALAPSSYIRVSGGGEGKVVMLPQRPQNYLN